MLLAKSEKNIWLMLSHRTIQQRSDEARSSFAEISKISECHGNPHFRDGLGDFSPNLPADMSSILDGKKFRSAGTWLVSLYRRGFSKACYTNSDNPFGNIPSYGE
jgi:hypothetical protein